MIEMIKAQWQVIVFFFMSRAAKKGPYNGPKLPEIVIMSKLRGPKIWPHFFGLFPASTPQHKNQSQITKIVNSNSFPLILLPPWNEN